MKWREDVGMEGEKRWAHLAWTVPEPAHLFLIPGELTIKFLDLHLDGGHPCVCLEQSFSIPPRSVAEGEVGRC